MINGSTTLLFFLLFTDLCFHRGFVCDQNAQCLNGRCVCDEGYKGDGMYCFGWLNDFVCLFVCLFVIVAAAAAVVAIIIITIHHHDRD